MIKNIILLMLILASTLQAGNLFSKLPYGMQIGKKLPTKVMSLSTHEKDSEVWKVSGKFYAIAKDGSSDPILSHINMFGVAVDDEDKNHRPPKKWRKAGIKFCDAYNDGSSLDDILKIAKKDGAFNIEIKNKKDGKIISFDIDKTLNYYMEVAKTKECKSGLHRIYIGAQEEEDDEY